MVNNMAKKFIQHINWSPFFNSVPEDQLNRFKEFTETHPLKQIDKNGHEFTYIDCGKGPKTLIFCHGAQVRGDMFFYPITKLEKGYRIIAPRFGNHDLNPLGAVEWIKAIREKEKISTFTIVGYSFGGGVAQLLMRLHPDWLDGVVLTHTSNLYRQLSAKKLKVIGLFIRLLPFSFVVKKIRQRRKNVSQELEWYEFYQAYFEEITYTLTKQDIIQWIKNSTELIPEIKGVSAPKFEKPMVILGTEGDHNAFPYFHQLCEIYPHAKAHIFREEGGHHYIFLHPERYTKVLSSMITEMK
jgi:pimeloyl-ACP methyl ester carboxylesterase